MKNLAEFYNLKCEKSVQPMGSTSIAYLISIVDMESYRINFYNGLNEQTWEESFFNSFNRSSNEFLIDFHEFLNLNLEEQLSIIP